jgi:acyl-CoA thioesterase-1
MTRLVLALALVLAAAIPARAGPVTILALGDSLTAGYGLPPEEAFPVKLEAALRAEGLDVTILNGGVSGDTAADGAARLDWALDDRVNAVIVELGANDALRGLPPEETERSLDQVMAALARRGLPVLIAGMEAPRNLGPAYAAKFDPIYRRLAEKYGALLYPFFLEGVAADPALNQGDGLHPNPKGVAVIVQRMAPLVAQLVARAAAK